MKVLIIYYSRTGMTKKVAERLATEIGAEIEAIVDNVNRSGVMGYLKSGREGGAKKEVKIEEIKSNLDDYDLVIIGSPVWVGNMASPVRAFIKKYSDKTKKIAFFATQGASKKQKLFKEVDEIFGDKLISKEFFTAKEVAGDNFANKLNNFINKLK